MIRPLRKRPSCIACSWDLYEFLVFSRGAERVGRLAAPVGFSSESGDYRATFALDCDTDTFWAGRAGPVPNVNGEVGHQWFVYDLGATVEFDALVFFQGGAEKSNLVAVDQVLVSFADDLAASAATPASPSPL